MKQVTLALLLLLGMFRPSVIFAESNVSIGGGFGALYSGIGVNIGLRGENNFGYVAAGCIGVGHSQTSGWLLPCGIGAGWIWTGFFSQTDHRHGLGFYVGPVGADSSDNGDDDTAVYGLGVTYVYFLHGINSRGWGFGITPAAGQYDGATKGSLLLNIGYQY